MKFTSEMMKKAWAIRKEAANKFNCKVMNISWGFCLKMAKGKNEMEDNKKTKLIKMLVVLGMKQKSAEKCAIQKGIFGLKRQLRRREIAKIHARNMKKFNKLSIEEQKQKGGWDLVQESELSIEAQSVK